MSKTMDTLSTWYNMLADLGYEPAFYEEDGELFEQLDCIIDGVNFSICGDDEEEDVLWYSIIFEPNDELDQTEKDKIMSLDGGVFEDVLFAEDNTVHILLKSKINVSMDFADDIISSILDSDGVVQYLKSISYVW